jgi:hypothetical protein
MPPLIKVNYYSGSTVETNPRESGTLLQRENLSSGVAAEANGTHGKAELFRTSNGVAGRKKSHLIRFKYLYGYFNQRNAFIVLYVRVSIKIISN